MIHLRIMQVLLFIQLVLIFSLQMPLAFEQFRNKNERTLKLFGIFGLEDPGNFEWYVRINLVLASFAATFTTMYKRATVVLENSPQRTIVQETTIIAKILGIERKTENAPNNQLVAKQPTRESKNRESNRSSAESKLLGSQKVEASKSFIQRLGSFWQWV